MPDPVEGGFEYAVRVLQDLIRIPSVAPEGKYYKEAAELLARELENLALNVDVIEVPRDYQAEKCREAGPYPRYIVLGRLSNRGPRLHFNGHYDVVPGGEGWTITKPFEPRIVDGKLYGRGAIDMKGGIAAVLGALRALQLSGRDPVVGVEAAFVPDEEIGGECGTGYLVEHVLKDNLPDYTLIPEPSGLRHPWHGHKGVLWARITVKGKNAHGSTPWRGKNAFLIASRLALELQRAYTVALSQRKSRYKTIPEESMYPTAMIGGEAGVPGGGKTNQVPGSFYFTVDRRLIPEETVAQAREELEALLRWAAIGLGGVDYEVEYPSSMEPAINDPGPLYEALRSAARKAGVEVDEPIVCPGGLDLRYYTAKGVKTLAYGPEGHTAHAPDEYIDLEELRKLVEIFYYMVSDGAVWP